MSLDLHAWRIRALRLEGQLNEVVLDQRHAIRIMLIAIFSRGHVLLEGDVGVGKTTLLRAVARGIGGAYERVEGTTDLMPGDMLYHGYIGDDGRPRVEPGPCLAQGENLAVFFFNEINRARPQVHALLLRLMAERTANAFNRVHHLPHLQVFADRNRVEREETFELPAAARDRFAFEIVIEAPRERSLLRELMFDTRFHDTDALIAHVAPGALDHTALAQVAGAIQARVTASAALEDYGVDLWLATQAPQRYGVTLDDIDMADFVAAGMSPRGAAMLMRAARVQAWLEGREHVLPEDLQKVFADTVAHRICFLPAFEIQREQYARRFAAGVLQQVGAP